MPLHLTKIAFGCSSLPILQERLATRGDQARLTTRYRPKRAEEIVGGSLYWIIGNRLAARSPIIGFEDAEGGRTNIVITATAIPVSPVPRRVHQGWRYLEAADAPPDLAADAHGHAISAMPDAMRDDLVTLGLV